ncbi:MAG: Obg family GTPase CgtA, partial [Clostridia bacterium]
GKKLLKITAITKLGVEELINNVASRLKDLPKPKQFEFEKFEYEEKDKNEYFITEKDGVYYVTGTFVEELARKSYLDDTDSFNWFQIRMRERGIIKDLKLRGAKDGDTICVLDLEFEMID